MREWLIALWYQPAPPPLWLRLLSRLYGVLMRFRTHLYQRGFFIAHRLPVPVVVVGNITTGGTGKTPLTIALALALKQRGWHPGIISRGYGSLHRHARPVQPPHSALSTGDEPLLMARSTGLPVWVGHDRAETGSALLQDNPRVNVIICDDGLQHLSLVRDFEIAVIDARRGLGNGWLLPGGPLRDPSTRLDSVDAIVINGDSSLGKTRYRMELEPQSWVNLAHPDRQFPPGHFAGQTCHGVAGISNPARFFATLKSLGVEVVEHAYPDHHPFVATDLQFATNLPILMTEKDGIKCTSFAPHNAYELRVTARVDVALVERLHNFLRERIHGQ